MVKKRGQPTLYGQWYTKWRIFAFWPFFGPFWPFFRIFCPLQATERYIMYETLLERWALGWKWGVNQVSTVNGTRNREFLQCDPFWAILSIFWIFGSFQASERYIMYEILLEKWVLRSKWAVYRPHTMNISGDIEFSCFLPYILLLPKLRYLQTPCTGGLSHLDEAIFGIFLIVITLHRLPDCAGSIFGLWPTPTLARYHCFHTKRNGVKNEIGKDDQDGNI